MVQFYLSHKVKHWVKQLNKYKIKSFNWRRKPVQKGHDDDVFPYGWKTQLDSDGITDAHCEIVIRHHRWDFFRGDPMASRLT